MLKLFFRKTRMIHAKRLLVAKAVLTALPLPIGLALAIVFSDIFESAIPAFAAIVTGLLLLIIMIVTDLWASFSLGLVAGVLSSAKYDRAYFIPRSPVRDAEAWLCDIREKCGSIKLESVELSGTETPMPLYFGEGKALSVASDRLERFVLIYRTQEATEAVCKEIQKDAKRRMKAIPLPMPKDEHKKSKENAKLSYGTAAVVIILADSVTDSAALLAKEILEFRYGFLYTVIADCKENRVYLAGEKHPHMSLEHDVQVLIGKVVFGTSGEIPKDSNAPYSAEYHRLYSEMEALTYGDFLKELKGARKESEEDELRLYEELRDGEMRLKDGMLYCAAEGKLMSMQFFAEDHEEASVETVPAFEGRVLTYDPFFLCWEKPKNREMKEADKAVYLPRMLAYMRSLGYEPKEESESED